jgi:hypothetical protein
MSTATELLKMQQCQPASQFIGEFIEWLHENKMEICHRVGDVVEYNPDRRSIEQLLADYFEIDLVKVENERRRILDEFQKKMDEALK